MKTLKTLLALSLLVSAVAPMVAMEDPVVIVPVAEPVAPVAPEAATPVVDAAPEAPTFFDKAFASVKVGAQSAANLYTFKGIKNEDGNLNKLQVAKSAGLWLATAAAVTGLGYAVYSFFASDEDEATDETDAPVSENRTPDAPVLTTEEVVAPVNDFAAKRLALRAKQEEVRARNARNVVNKRAKASKAKRGGCSKPTRKSSCKPCQA